MELEHWSIEDCTHIRKALGLTLEEVGQTIGLTRQQMSNIERCSYKDSTNLRNAILYTLYLKTYIKENNVDLKQKADEINADLQQKANELTTIINKYGL